MKRFAAFLVRRRTVVLAVLLPATIVLAAFGIHLSFDFTPQAIYAGDGDLLESAEDFQSVFGHDDAVLLVVVEALGPDDVLAPAVLRWVPAFTARAAQVPDVARVTSLATVQVPDTGRFTFGVPDLVPLLGPDPGGGDVRPRLTAWFERQPMLREAFLSEDLRWMSLHVHLAPQARSVEASTAVVQAVEGLLADLGPPSGYAARLAGLPHLRVAVVADLEHEQIARLPVTALVFFLVLLVAYRHAGTAIAPLVAVGAGLAWTAGALVLLRQSLNIISNMLPILLFTIGSSNCVHVLARYQEELQRIGSRRVAAVRAIRHMVLACLLTYLTTAIGFLSLVTARSRVLNEIAWQTSLGLVLLYVATIVGLGALLPYLRPPRAPRGPGGGGPLLSRVTAGAGFAVARHPVPLLGLSAALIVVSLLLARHLPVDCRLLETYEDDHPVSKGMRDVDAHLGGVLALDVDLRGDEDGTFLRPEVVAGVEAVEEAARADGESLTVRSYVDVQDAVLRNLPAPPATGDADAVREGRIQLAHRLAGGLADVVGYHRYLAPDGRRARIEICVPDLGSTRVLALASRLEAQIAQHLPPALGVRTRLTGHGYLSAAAMDHFIRDVLTSLGGAAVVIFLVIALLFRSPRYGFISVLPNLTPLVLTLGYMAVRGYEISATSAIVFAISLGVAVDNTIHFLARFREEWGRRSDLGLAIRRTLLGAGRAMVLTSVLIVLGLAVLHASSFIPTRRFAELTSVTMIAALFGDLLILPACLKVFGAPRPRAAPPAAAAG